VRPAAWAGSFYPAQRGALRETIAQLTAETRAAPPLQAPAGKVLKGLILPHAGYVYSGLTAAHAARVLTPGRFRKVILLGPDHRVGFHNAAVSSAEAWETPLGNVGVHPDARQLLQRPDLFRTIAASDRSEHSLEVILPFLQTYLDAFEIVPIVLGRGDFQRFAGALQGLLTPETLVVASSDLSHFLTYREAVRKDRKTIRWILDLDTDRLLSSDNSACGKLPVLVLAALARRNGWQAVLLHYCNSGDVTGDHTRVVGYAALAFYGEPNMQTQDDSTRLLTPQQGQVLVRLARHTLMEKLGRRPPTPEAQTLSAALTEQAFQTCRGTFVTLKAGGRLRGCIGNLSGLESLAAGIRHNALNAAFHDHRFSPLKAAELDRVAIEVSILTEPTPLAYQDGDDLLAKLRVGVDGVILRKGPSSATFLPQVWDQLPDPAAFLTQLCRKAGLPGDAWRTTRLEVATYQVQNFAEDK
jgi:AmmeMemoRadiSam system protein B/AmmeMemoRadiSam system protein A